MSHHILFVDDDAANLVVWQAAFADQYRVLVAGSAAAGLELMATHPVAVVVADQRMPGMTGTEMLARVRDEFPHAIRILITAYAELGAAVDAINRGAAWRYLRKPCLIPELSAGLAEAVDLYDLRWRVHTMERRLVTTERVYALGLVASGIGREIARPAARIREAVTAARSELLAVVTRLDAAQIDADLVKLRLTEIAQALDGALDGVERVIQFASSVTPSAPGATEHCDLHEVLRLALRAVRGELRSTAQLKLDLAPAPLVMGSAAQLGQVVLNLLVSALDGAAKGPVEGRLVTVRARASGRCVTLEVDDTGPPIPEDDLAHLFDPFHASRHERGTGLGLAISRAIAQEVGGAVDISNRPGGGVAYRLTLVAVSDVAS